MNRPRLAPTLSPSRFSPPAVRFHRLLSHLWLLLLLTCAFYCLPAAAATVPNLITKPVDTSLVTPLAQHHPSWAVAANQISQVPADQDLEQLTLVLSRPAAQQQAFEQLLADQQNPSSPSYHKWLTATEIGTRFGVSDSDIAAISGWLASQSLHVNFVSPDRTQVGFGGTAANIDQAFGATLAYYNVHGQQRLSVGSEPTIPQALSASIKSVRGLFAVGERPFHAVSVLTSASPELTTTDSKGNVRHFITPADFSTIYDIPSAYTGAGYTIGIVSWARVSTADLDNFRSLTSTSFANPTVVIPTAYGGIDPGAAYTTAPSCTNDCLGGQSEATLDVIRAGSTAPGASLLLVASSSSGSHDGIGADTQYIVYNNAANILSISFGACESDAGSSNVAFYDSLFSTAAGQGISVFVSSGDSGAAGCDDAFAIPGSVVANSPNYICSSKYATCVGGTQFADTTSPSTYWSSSNTTGYKSVISYIPEGGWNESDTGSKYGVAGSGGGVSTFIATPTWQTGTGVPSARTGRYTPDVSFSSSDHDGYFGCLAAGGSNTGCVVSSGSFGFLSFSGTSAAAPGMAGVAALLNQKMGAAQGNLNPKLYALASSTPSAFHDVTVSSSGVSSCSVNTPSICNSSIYYTSSGAVQPGFLVTTGYDEVTGLGSLDVANFLTAYSTSTTTAPTVTVTPGSTSITTAQSLAVTVTVSGSGSTPTGTVALSSGSYTSSATTLSSGSATVNIPAGSLASGSATITASYIPDSSSSTTYSSATGTATTAVTVTKSTPSVAVTPGATSITTAQALSVSVAVSAGTGTAAATGTVTLSSGSYTSSAATLSSGSATISVPAGSLAVGTPTLTATYAPDTAGATIYNGATSSAVSVTVTKSTPLVSVSTSNYISIVPGEAVAVNVIVSAGTARPSGSVVLSSGSYSSSATTLSSGLATITIPAGTFSVGAVTLTATYTPDTTGDTLYNSATGTGSLTVAKATPTVTASASPTSITTVQTTAITVTVTGNTGDPTPSGSVVLTSGAYTSAASTLSSGTASITIPAGSLSTGSNTVTATYTPDTTGAVSFNTSAGTTSVTVGTVAPTLTVTPAASSVSIGQSLQVTIAASGGSGNPTVTGSVVLTSGSYTSAATALTSGAASITIPAGSLTASTATLTATYTPDTAGTATYKTSTGTASVTVTKLTPTVTVSPASSSVVANQSLSVPITVSSTYGTPSGSVVLSSGSYTSSSTTLSAGAASISIPASTFSAGTTTLTATYTPDTTGALTYNSATGTGSVTVTPAPTFTVAGTSVTASKGSSGTSTVTITPANGFTGPVTLTASIASSPSGALYSPTLSFGSTSPVTISGTSPSTATLTISTTAATSAAATVPARPGSRWYATGGAVLACLFFFLRPSRRRTWRNLTGMIVLFAALASGLVACGGSSISTGTSGTTAGTYTITITGTSGSTTATNTITLTVQ